MAATASAYASTCSAIATRSPSSSLRALAASTAVATTALLVLLSIAADAVLFPRRARSLSAALTVVAPAAALVIPLAMRPAPRPAAPVQPVSIDQVKPLRRVTLIGIDGLSPAFVQDGVARGNLPAFARLLRRGASGALATLRPTEAPPIWTTILTGRLPRDHGVKSFATYRLRGSSRTYELLPKGALVGLLERTDLVATSPSNSTSRRRRRALECA